MAISSGVIWEIRTTGAYNNGGGFNPDRLGVDRSQQDSPHQVYTDLVIDAAIARKITSAANPFTSADAGNILRIDSSAGFTAGWYEIVAVSGSNVAVVDRNAGTLGSTGGGGRLGGAWGVLQNSVVQLMVPGNRTYVKFGTYAITGILSLVAGTTRGEVKLIGYTNTRGDGGRPVLSSTAVSVSPIVNLGNIHTILQNFTINGSGVTAIGVAVSGLHNLVDNVLVQKCTQRGFSFFTTFDRFGNSWFRRCAAIECSGGVNEGAFWIRSIEGIQPVILFQCVARDNYTNGFRINNNTQASMLYCLSIRSKTVAGSGGHGILVTTGPGNAQALGPCIDYATIYSNEGDGILFANGRAGTQSIIQNTIFQSNQGYGIRSGELIYPSREQSNLLLRRNAYFGNTLGTHSNILSGSTEIYLTGTAFVDPNTNDFRLNNGPGGNQCHAVGSPGTFPLFPNTFGTADIGAVQTGPEPF